MPHRTLLGVIRGDARPNHSDAKVDEVTDGYKGSESSNKADNRTEMGISENGSSTESPPNADLRLLKPYALEQGLWRQAWDDVASELEKMLPEEFQPIEALDTATQVRAVHIEAQKRAENARKSERKIPYTNKTYRQIYGKVANCANKFQIVGDMVSQAEPVYAALPWAMIRFAIQCSVGEDEAYHTMLSGAELVSDLASQYAALEQLYAKIDSEFSQKLQKSLKSLYKTILQFQVYAINYFDPHGKARRALTGLNPITADNITHRRQEIDQLKRQVDEDAALVSYEVAKTGIDNLQVGQAGQDQQLAAIKEGLRALAGNTGQAFRNLSKEQEERNRVLIGMWKEPLEDLMSALESREIEKARKNLHSVRKWLSAAVPRNDLTAAKEKRPMPLGNWLLNHPKFEHWQSTEQSSMLFCHGFAGTGKTGLVCRVLEHLEALGERIGRVAYFFCSNDKAKSGITETFSRSDPEELLRSVVSQLATSQDGSYVAPSLQSKYDAFGPDGNQPMNLAMSDCIDILATISDHAPITIVLDAFDELDRVRSPKLIQTLQQVISRAPTNIRIFISTRTFPAIEDDLVSEQSIEVAANLNGADIRTFIHATLGARIQQKALLNGKVPDDLKDEIEGTLTSRAGSMFLYASLLLNQLCDKNNNDDEISIRKKLECLPRDLTDVYHRIMAEIHDEKRNSERSCRIASNTISWLLCAQEPLHYEAFLEAISPPERKAKHDELIHACRTLVVKGENTYEFAHFSVREHVTQMDKYSASKCHLIATQSSLSILDISFSNDKQRRGLSDAQKAFEQYALLYWPLHYEGIREDDMRSQRTTINNRLRSLLLQGRSHKNKYNEWFDEVRKKEKQLKENKYLATKFDSLQASPLSPLFAACVFGLEDLISKFGRELDGLNKLNDHGQSALCLAIENDKLDVVKALLSRPRFPADPNRLNVKAVEQLMDWDNKAHDVVVYASAMQCAAATGHLDIAKYLIEQGAHIDLVAGFYGSPLQAAALKGHAAVVELLLRNGAEPNSQGGYYGNALQAAAAAGHGTIVNLLLENKPPALVETPGGPYGSALRAAVHSGNSDAVWALLEEKADPNAKTQGRGSVLEEAVSIGPGARDIVRDLLMARAKADLSPKDNEVHIMHRASMFGMVELVEHCLKNRCKIDMVTTKGPPYHRRFGDFPNEMTPLGYACAEGHVNIVELLLDHNAPFEHDKLNSAVLWTAAYRGHAEVVDLLLTRFKEVHGSEKAAQFLLQRPSPEAGHPIVWAGAASGNPAVVETLLDHGAKYENNWYRASPLLATATYACAEVTNSLLDYHGRGAVDIRINEQARNGRTALFEACSLKRPLIATMLLNAGADYRITENDSTTPLQVSCHKGLFRIVSAIIDKASKELDPAEFLTFLNTRHRPTGNTAVVDCAEQDRLHCLNLLLKQGADYTIRSNDNSTILHRACASRSHNPAILAAIIDKTSELDRHLFLDFLNTRHTSSGKTALLYCAERGRLDAMKLLLDHGANWEIAGHSGNTPLHWAAIAGYDEVAKLLLRWVETKDSHSALLNYVNRGNKRGSTPLLEASKSNHVSVVKTLLSYGANYVTARTGREPSNATALHEACFNGAREVVEQILEKARKELDPEPLAQFINARNSLGRTPLHDAAKTGRPKIANLLIDNGAQWDMVDNGGFTALHYCAFRNRYNVVRVLLERASQGADQERFTRFLNQQGEGMGQTVLHDVAHQGFLDVARLVLKYSPAYDIVDQKQETPLHVALLMEHVEMAALLVEHARARGDHERLKRFVNARTKSGETAWTIAMERKQSVALDALRATGVEEIA